VAESPEALAGSSRRVLCSGRRDREWRAARERRQGINKERDSLLDLALQRLDLLARMAALEQRFLRIDPHDPYRVSFRPTRR